MFFALYNTVKDQAFTSINKIWEENFASHHVSILGSLEKSLCTARFYINLPGTVFFHLAEEVFLNADLFKLSLESTRLSIP